jgi:hypothetical protein
VNAADPTWPLFVLAAIQLGDAVASFKPMEFARQCFEDVGFPRKHWWVFTPIKLAAGAGLVVGAWVPEIGLAACLGLVVYFLLAIGAHVHARDFGRNLFVNATGMLVLTVGTTYLCFVS